MKSIVKGLTVDYDVLGEGKPVLILCKSMMFDFEPIFRETTGWKRIYVDVPGYGESQVDDSINSSDDILNILLGFVDDVLHKEKFLLMGFSYLSYLARGILKNRVEQVSGIAILCPVIYAERSKRDIPLNKIFFKDEKFISNLNRDDIDELDMFAVQNKKVWEKFQDYKKETSSSLMNMELFNKLKQNGTYEFSFNVNELTTPFNKPALILLGRQDYTVGYSDAWRIIENFPRATFAILDMASHFLPFEQTYLYNTLVSDWLKRVEMDID